MRATLNFAKATWNVAKTLQVEARLLSTTHPSHMRLSDLDGTKELEVERKRRIKRCLSLVKAAGGGVALPDNLMTPAVHPS